MKFKVLAGLIITGFACLLFWSRTETNTAPNSNFVMLDGTSKTIQDLRGKVILINFWATSCTTCVAEMPALTNTFQKHNPNGFHTIAVAMKYDPPSYVINYAQSRKLPFDVAIDNTGNIAKEWGDVQLTPTTYIVNKSGIIVKRYVGTPDFGELDKLLTRLLNES